MIVQRVREILERTGIRYAVIGAIAVAARGIPRFTADFDFFTADRRVFDPELWSELRSEEIPVDIRKGDFDDSLGGVVRIGQVHEVDIVVAKWKWELAVIERAEPVDIAGAPMPVPTTGDLILLKVAAGGQKDRNDVTSLLEFGPREPLLEYVRTRIAELPESLRSEVEEALQLAIEGR
jgi:predicted nucleotidyltransferase